jgi:hypothetical protein
MSGARSKSGLPAQKSDKWDTNIIKMKTFFKTKVLEEKKNAMTSFFSGEKLILDAAIVFNTDLLL